MWSKQYLKIMPQSDIALKQNQKLIIEEIQIKRYELQKKYIYRYFDTSFLNLRVVKNKKNMLLKKIK